MEKNTFEAHVVPYEKKKVRVNTYPETQKKAADPFAWEIREEVKPTKGIEAAAPVDAAEDQPVMAQEETEPLQETMAAEPAIKTMADAVIPEEEAEETLAEQEAGEPEEEAAAIEEVAATIEEEGEKPIEALILPPEDDPGIYENNGIQRINTQRSALDTSKQITYEQFLQENPKSGMLRVQVFAGSQSIPLSGVRVIISKEFMDGIREFYEVYTNRSGIAENIILPAPDKEYSQKPEEICCPYAAYQIKADKDGFQTMIYPEVPIYDGIKSIQPVQMLPGK